MSSFTWKDIEHSYVHRAFAKYFPTLQNSSTAECIQILHNSDVSPMVVIDFDDLDASPGKHEPTELAIKKRRKKRKKKKKGRQTTILEQNLSSEPIQLSFEAAEILHQGVAMSTAHATSSRKVPTEQFSDLP
jgi:hypothetical protein